MSDPLKEKTLSTSAGSPSPHQVPEPDRCACKWVVLIGDRPLLHGPDNGGRGHDAYSRTWYFADFADFNKNRDHFMSAITILMIYLLRKYIVYCQLLAPNPRTYHVRE